MNTARWWSVGARLPGIYFVVIGAVTATGALMMAGVGIPDEMDRGIMVAVPVLACHVHAPTAAGTKEHKDGHFFLVPMGAGQQMITPAIRLVADFTRPLSHR